MRALMGRLALAMTLAAALVGCSVTVPGVAAPDVSARSLVAPTVDPVPPGDRFSDAKRRFTIAPPKGWTADTSGVQGTAVVFVAPEPVRTGTGSFSANINVVVVPSAADLTATIAAARQELHGFRGYASTADTDVVLFGGTLAHLLGGTFSDKASGLPLRNLQIFAVHDGSTTVVTGTAPASDWDSYEAVFEAALRTLTVAR